MTPNIQDQKQDQNQEQDINNKIKCIQILTYNCNKRKRIMMKNNLNEMENDYEELIFAIKKWYNVVDICSFFLNIQTISKQLSEYIKQIINIITSSEICNHDSLYSALTQNNFKESLSELLVLKTNLQQYFNCKSSCSNIDFPFISIIDIPSLKIKAKRHLLKFLETLTLLYVSSYQSQKTWEPNKLKLNYNINDSIKYLFKIQKLYYKMNHFIKHIENYCDLQKKKLIL